MELPVIGELVVVEGVRDAAVVRRAVQADTLVLGGIRIHRHVLASLARAQAARGVILFTDPDYAGEAIRRRIASLVPGVRHAYIARREACRGSRVGVEYAAPEGARDALLRARATTTAGAPEAGPLSWDDYCQLGFVGSAHSRRLREQVAGALRIGYGNGKYFYQQLRLLCVTKEELLGAWRQATA